MREVEMQNGGALYDELDFAKEWPYGYTTTGAYADVITWETRFLQYKVLHLSATTNNIKVKVLGSRDNGATFAYTILAETTLTAGATATEIEVEDYHSAIKIQAEDDVVGVHGILTVTGEGTSIPEGVRSGIDRTSGAWSAHRSAIVAADKISTPTITTAVDEVDKLDGAINAGTACKVAISAGTSFGPSGAGTGAAILAVSCASDGKNTHSLLLTIPQATGADADTIYYIFCSTDAAPKLLGAITEAQRATGQCSIKANGVVTAAQANVGNGQVRICTLGAGDQTTATRFVAANLNNAYLISPVTAIDCSSHKTHYLTISISQTGTQMNVAGAPACTMIAFFTDKNGVVSQGASYTLLLMAGNEQSKKQSLSIDVSGAAGVRYLLNPAYCTVDVWVEAI